MPSNDLWNQNPKFIQSGAIRLANKNLLLSNVVEELLLLNVSIEIIMFLTIKKPWQPSIFRILNWKKLTANKQANAGMNERMSYIKNIIIFFW